MGIVSEEITSMITSKDYADVIKKCQSMSFSKQKYAILSVAYLGLKQWKNLIEVCDKGLEFDSNEPDFYSLKAKAMGKLGKNHERILLLRKAIDLNSSVASYHRNLGSAYYVNLNYDLAVQEYDKAIQIEPDNLMNYHNKGSALYKDEKYKEAKECFLLALQKNSNVALSYSWLADCDKMMGNFEEAEKNYKKAFEISGNAVYQQEMAKIQGEKNLYKHKGSWMYGLAWLGNKIF